MSPEEIGKVMEIADFKKHERDPPARGQGTAVANPPRPRRLKPWYRVFCKRPTFNDEYLPTFNRPNVTLVDVGFQFKGVERDHPEGRGVGQRRRVRRGRLHHLCVGLRGSPRRSSGGVGFVEIYGRNGQTLFDYYAASTAFAPCTGGIPATASRTGSTSASGQNRPVGEHDRHVRRSGARHVAYIIKEVKARGAVASRASTLEKAEEEWVALIRKLAITNRDYQNACTPGYYNNEGGEPSGGSKRPDVQRPASTSSNALLAGVARRKANSRGLQLST